MDRHREGLTRGEFIALTGAALPALALARAGGGATVPDTILVGGKVLTVDAADTVVQAVAVKDGLILQTGTDATIRALASPTTNVIELKGRVVTPGFVDPHNHFQLYGLCGTYYTPFVQPAVKNIADLQAALVPVIAATPAGQWINGYYWMADIPNRHDLDPVSPNHPVWVFHQGGHYGSANSRALALAGITAATESPEGGIVEKDAYGEPTGVFYNHRAMDMLRKAIPLFTDDDLRHSLMWTQQTFASFGVTSFQDNNIRSDYMTSYQDLYREGRLYLRGDLYYTLEYPSDLDRALNGLDHYHDELTRVAGYKFLIDGQGPTAYCHEPHNGTSWDMPTWEPGSFKQTLRALHDTGLQICVHCIGDAAVDLALDAYEEALNANPRADARHRIEHCILSKPDATARMKDLGIVVSTNPGFIRSAGTGWLDLYGEERCQQHAVVIRDWLEAGVPVAIGSDSPTNPLYSPQATMATAMARTTASNIVIGPGQMLTFMEALRLHTIGAAYAAHEEAVKGSIEAGKVADLVVWTKDPTSLTPYQLWNTTVDMTIVGGRVVYPLTREPRRHLDRA
jgi:predicted amidohydrolase YtcJ